MSLACPHCGGAIVQLLGGDSGANGGANPVATSAQTAAQIDRTRNIAQGSEVQDREPSTNKGKTYNQGYEQEFLSFWSTYPLRRDKRKAQIAWRKAVARLVASGIAKSEAKAIILAGAKRYAEDPNRDDAFTKYAEGWLNGDGWDDDPLPFRLRPGGPRPPESRPHGATADAEAIRDLLDKQRHA